MEIFLQCAASYKIPDWNGSVEVRPMMLYQMKRMIGSRNQVSLFRKIIKIFKSEQAPITLPTGLQVEDLDIGDFMQLLVAIAATSRARQVKKIYECPHCKADQPRVVDIIAVFKPRPPEIEGGAKDLPIGASGNVTCNYIRVQDYMSIKEAVESIRVNSYDKGVLVLDKVRTKYGRIYEFNDADDLDDFCNLLDDMGMAALRMSIGDMDFEAKLKWLFSLSGDEQAYYKEIFLTTNKLSANMDNEYKSVCTACGKNFKADLEPTDYFFDFQ